MARKNTSALTPRELLPLLGITVSAFIFNTSEFMPVGLLTDIGATFGTDEGTTGLIVSVYAWAVMILSVSLMMLASRIPFKPLIVLVLGVFCAGQLLSAIAATYGMLVVARLVVACAHSVFWAIAAPIAARLVDPQHGALAVSVVVAGSALAMIVGLPLGRVIGLLLGWRQTFACVGAVSFAVLLYLLFVFPRLEGAAAFKLNQLPSIFKNKVLVGVFVVTALYPMGYYTCYSYIEPFMLQISHFPADWITMLLTVFGFAGLLGSLLFSKLYNAHRYSLLASTIFLLVIALSLFYPLAGDLYAICALCVLWGMAATAFNVGLQAETIQVTTSAEAPVAMSIFSGIFNLGIGSGTWLGGLLCTYISITCIGFAGAAFAFLAFLYCVLKLIPDMKKEG